MIEQHMESAGIAEQAGECPDGVLAGGAMRPVAIFHFLAGMADGIAIAICLEYDLITQADTMDGMPEMCLDMLQVLADGDGDPWSGRVPPPPDIVAEFRSLPEFREFTIALDPGDRP